MKKFLLSVLSVFSFTAFSQWQTTPIFSTGWDCISAFGNVYSSGCPAGSALDVSSNDGANWTSVNTGIPSGGLYFGTYYSNKLYACRNNTIAVLSSSLGTWATMTNTFTGNHNVKSMTAMSGTVMAGVNNISALNWRVNEYNGSSWVPKGASIAGQVSCLRFLNGALYAGTTGTCVMKSTDAGVTFSNSSAGIPTPATFDKYIICMAATSSAIFCGTQGGRICRSTNNGTSWTVVRNMGNGSNSFDISDIYVMSNNNILVACDSGFFYSVDNGTTWTMDNAGLSSSETQLNHITVSGGMNPYIIATNKNGKLHRRPLNEIFSGINEISNSNIQSKVYPNPSTDAATIEVSDLMFEKDCEVRIADVLGREVLVNEMKNGKADINLSGVNKGIYSYSIYHNKNTVGKGKLLVN